MRRPALLLAVIGALAAAGCGSSVSVPSSTSAPASGSAPSGSGATTGGSAASGAGCRSVTAPAARNEGHLTAPRAGLDPARAYTVTFATNCGTFAVRLDVRRSPRTAASFAFLVRRGFFDGLTFHRVAQGFVIQGGDPTGAGGGGPGYTVVEPPPAGYRYQVGDLAMAKTQSDPPGASGSQFFVLTGNAASLPPEYALLGHVVSGMGAVERIAALASPQGDGPPTQPVVMSHVNVTSS